LSLEETQNVHSQTPSLIIIFAFEDFNLRFHKLVNLKLGIVRGIGPLLTLVLILEKVK
jgi:hypothetical protein